MPLKRVIFIVEVDLPAGATRRDMHDYVKTEITAGFGGRHPDDPLFDTNRESITVTDVSNPDMVSLLNHCMTPILRRQAMYVLKNGTLTRDWFATERVK